MKVLLVIIFVLYLALFGVVIFGVEKGLKNISPANTVVQIDRSPMLAGDTTLQIACEKATLNYEKRVVTIEGLVSIANKWVVEKMEIKDNKLVIYIPPDANYEIRIGPQLHRLPKIKISK